MVKLTDVKGVGVSAARKLERVGVRSVGELAELDLRSVAIDGLSPAHIAYLRDSARRFLEAQKRPDLTLVEGLGPSARRKLERAGVTTVDQLADLDLRTRTIPGLSTAHLQKLKRNARYLLPP